MNYINSADKGLSELFCELACPTGDSPCGVVQEQHLRTLLNNIDLYPSRSQIGEVVHCACELSGRVPADHVTLGEFLVLVSELKEHYRQQTTTRNNMLDCPRSQMKSRTASESLHERRNKHNNAGHVTDCFQVFLGGSCNPTTWREDVAIPFFKKHNITFYNPQQVTSWHPQLIETEDQAKQAADLLFFVIDNQTRSVASIIEAAYLAGCSRQLILVIKPLEQPIVVAGETLLDREVDDIQRSHLYLTDLVEQMSIPVFSDLHTALECTRVVLQRNISVADLSVVDGAKPVKYPHLHIANKLVKLKEVFNELDVKHNGRLSQSDVQLAFKTLTGGSLPAEVTSSTGELTFDEFCCVVSQHRYMTGQGSSYIHRLLESLYKLFTDWLSSWLPSWTPVCSSSEPKTLHVYLGGSCGLSNWRNEVAIPLLLKHGLTFYNPQLIGRWSERFIPREAAMKETCQLLLFVITHDTRSITSMLEAAHYIGRGCLVVLCVQNMSYGTPIGSDQSVLSHTAIDDYNRARAYLCDIARREGLPVHTDVHEAVAYSIQQLCQ